MQKREYKVGDYVFVKKDLVGGTRYRYTDAITGEYLYFHPLMEKFRGRLYRITNIVCSFYTGYTDYRLSLGEEQYEWVFNDAMLEKPIKCLRSLICKRKN